MDSESWKWIKDIWRRVPKAAVIILLLLIVTGFSPTFWRCMTRRSATPGSGCCRPPGKREDYGRILWVRIPWGAMSSAA